MDASPASFAEAFSLAGENVLLTGASGGLGTGIASCLIAAGAKVVLSGTNADKLAKLGDKLGPRSSWVVHDVTQARNAERFAEQVQSDHGPISVLINNAGNTVKRPIAEMSIEDFESVLSTHVTGSFALTRAFLPQISAQHGSVLFTASMTSFLGLPNVAGYAAAKSAFLGLVRSLSVELAPQGVRVNAVAPGWVDTPMYRQATQNDPQRVQTIMGRIPMKELGRPEDIGWAMTYLSSRAARYVSGHVLVVDGGALHAL